MTTAAAIDRLVHHSVIIELNVPSYRVETAKNQQGKRCVGSWFNTAINFVIGKSNCR